MPRRHVGALLATAAALLASAVAAGAPGQLYSPHDARARSDPMESPLASAGAAGRAFNLARGAEAQAAPSTAAAAGAAPGLGYPPGSDPSFDHQTTPYAAQFEPVTATVTGTVQAFFSPDHSIDTLTELVQSVPQGGVVTIGSPGLSSWSGCTRFDGTCVGCTVDNMAKEQFPIFAAMLNAVHEAGATVRLLTNNYGTPTCAGQISPLDFLALNGVDVRHYTTTTFMHAKYITVSAAAADEPEDAAMAGPRPASAGRVTAVSSVNWSFTSFMENREAGMVLKAGTEVLQDIYYAAWKYDFAQAPKYVVNQTYSAADMAKITSTAHYPVVIPPPKEHKGAFVTPPPVDVTATMGATAYVSPDFSRDQALADLQEAKSEFALHIYQVTDFGICSQLAAAARRGVNVTMLVSSQIFDKEDRYFAEQCYYNLTTQHGFRIRLTPSYYTYSHQKFWFTDGRLSLSSGNWSPSDLPDATKFPPYPSQGWTNANRDVNIKTDAPAVVALFRTVMEQDYERGSDYVPTPPTPPTDDDQ
eukprot:CAMPEP_0203818922 /NCGR_PEP_ID=MMETSP0115-20131106/33240_1 /ASSEMBLY_ACC=CAM_ASM_000227 /TAXON_ID=33651 /ORGANISM="Bicosoecid sp, Strain ms1" /LENGTH=529 /DNA_ID=CAMNT_0050727893 /DNA_START=45 /DNA_END=1634 /DNA_ORIENTATION=+